MTLNDMSLIFLPNKLLKHCKKCTLPEKFGYRVYDDKKLYLVVCINDYISRQNCLEQLKRKQLLITITKSHRRTSLVTWVKEIFADNNKIGFSFHGSQVASTNKVNTTSIDVDEIFHGGSWKTKGHFLCFATKTLRQMILTLVVDAFLFFIRN